MTRRVAVIGAGTRGTQWARVFVHARCAVSVFEPDSDARDAAKDALNSSAICFVDTLSDAVAKADWVQECVPERIALKQKIFQVIQANCTPQAVIASSSESLSLDDLQGCAMRPDQIVVARPVDLTGPVPTVALRFNDRTQDAFQDRARRFLTGIGCVLQP